MIAMTTNAKVIAALVAVIFAFMCGLVAMRVMGAKGRSELLGGLIGFGFAFVGVAFYLVRAPSNGGLLIALGIGLAGLSIVAARAPTPAVVEARQARRAEQLREVELREAQARASARWAPDPSGRHELRYWDGSRWTEHVIDAGRPGSDRLRGA